ncbi:50S ribosomal protein L21 [Candidatus Marinamargulisbacteria bacterium]|jgi:large subunit ribosomal protein L21|nr:50S ribosomal protein L21 [Candidatus Marinamargulisbacteria bacterium]
MIAIIEQGSKQFKVSVGSIVDIDLVENPPESISFDKVLLVSDESGTTIGKPYVESAVVQAEVLEPLHKDEKVTVFKFKTKTGYKVRQGHRQKYTRVRVTAIESGK